MYIKEIILDGFKSYSTRTKIGKFDPQFNAITGYNGSGKSNILDAICFVMGITTMKHIRVEKKQELIYKGGNSGVQKASVTLIFDNTNKNQSPPGYEEFNEISVNQTIQDNMSKYYINGRKETMERIKNLFCSVKLNVNNPHFLIMQGRVTKVINMKPIEVLGLIEEAAGTSLYQHKRDDALNRIKKKELKLQEIDSILRQEVTPKLEQLQKDKSFLDEYKAKTSQLEQHEKSQIAFQFYQCQKLLERGRDNQLQIEEQTVKQKIAEYQHKYKQIQKIISELEKSQNEDSSLKSLQDLISKKEIDEFKLQEELKNDEVLYKEFLKFQSDCKVQESALDAKKKRLENQTKEMQKETIPNLDYEIDQKKEQLRDAEDQIQKGDNNGDEFRKHMLKDIDNNIQNWETKLSQIQNEINRIQRLKNQTSENIQRLKKEEKEFGQRIEKIEKENREIEAKIKTYSYSDSQIREMKQELGKLQQAVNNKAKENAQFNQLKYMIDFDYNKAPLQNFPHNEIYGRLTRLFKVKDVDKYGMAIQTIAGGRLRNVVVEKHTVSRDLLQYKATRGQESFIPLNKIQYRIVEDEKVQKLKELTGGKVELALNLLEFDPKYKAALAHIFGQTFVAVDQRTAKTVSMENPMQKFNCVTIQGDSYRTDGILSGGAQQFQPILGKVQDYLRFEREMIKDKNLIDRLQQQIQQADKEQHERQQLEETLSQNQQRLQNFKNSGGEQASEQSRVEQEKLSQLDEELKSIHQKQQEAQEKQKQHAQEKADLQKQIGSLSKNGAAQFYQNRIKKIKSDFESLQKQKSKNIDQVSKFELEIEQINQECQKMNDKLTKESHKMSGRDQQIKQKQDQLSSLQNQLRDAKDRFNMLSQKKSKISSDVQDKTVQGERINQQLNELQEKHENILAQIKNYEQEKVSAKKNIQELSEKHKWIENDSHFFGQPGTNYDFRALDVSDLRQKIGRLKQEIDDQKTRVNFKVETMFDDAQSQYDKLLHKKDTIEENKRQIEENIKFLNEEKNKEIEKTWQIVSENCSKIFQILLPGAQAKLEIADKQLGVDGGLHLRVGFGGVWKESLAGLSGGQRSLLALSLILALLRFQPAPLYILDEIDSALDLSHTQNIGRIIKEFFKESQFIVVSLKEELFENANVLFRVRFLDSRSQVERHQIQN